MSKISTKQVKTEKELKKLAEDIYKGLVYTHQHIEKLEDIRTVFMPLAFIDKEQLDELINDAPGLMYEYLDKASPRTINGMPIFFSVSMLSIADAEKVHKYYNKIVKAIKGISE